MRWQHPERGLLLPGTFIEVTEKNRLIVPMGSWALTEACRQAEAWRRAGVGALRVGVNASAVQVCRADFAATVAQALQSTGCPAQTLEIEVTETALLQDAAAALRSLSEVKAFGVRVAMDDFGTGYSSLSALRDFPFDVLKIDRSFVMRLPHDGRTAAITRGIIDLSRRLGLDVVAEGVESAEQRDFLADAGCTLMQGYLFARPMAPDVALARLVG
jgi:EAL domain-containing protein (putative c-di-GMP-specific phosphodiesterase class I)